MREPGDRAEADHPGGPLECVGGAESPVEMRAVFPAGLQVHEARLQRLEQLAGFFEE